MFELIRELFHRRDLLYMLAWRDIRIKYKQSIMGMLWAILMPLVIVCAGFVVRFALATVSGKPLALTDVGLVAVKAAPWAFFVASLRFGTNSLISQTTLVTKIYLPRLVFPLAAVLSQLFDFLVAVVVLTLLLAFAGVGLSLQLFWLPILVITLTILASASVILLSATALFFRDVRFIVEVLLTFAIFFTPIFYESSLFGDWAPLLLLNPVSPLMEGISSVVILQNSPSLLWISYSFVFTTLLLTIALAVFKKLEPFFAESI
jgi:ABC-type polysaccharide/polyol phosphate export permease